MGDEFESTNQTIHHPQIGDLYWMTGSVNFLIEFNGYSTYSCSSLPVWPLDAPPSEWVFRPQPHCTENDSENESEIAVTYQEMKLMCALPKVNYKYTVLCLCWKLNLFFFLTTVLLVSLFSRCTGCGKIK